MNFDEDYTSHLQDEVSSSSLLSMDIDIDITTQPLPTEQEEEEAEEQESQTAALSYEEERQRKIERNKQRLAALGLTNQKIGSNKSEATDTLNSLKRKYQKKKKNATPIEKRKSERLKNKEQGTTAPDYVEIDEKPERRRSMNDSVGSRVKRPLTREEQIERMKKRPRRSFTAFVKPKKERLDDDEPIYLEWQGVKYVTRQGLAVHSGADTRNTTHPLKFDRYKLIRNTDAEPFVVVHVDEIDQLQQQYPNITIWHFKGNVMRLYTMEYANFLKEYYGYGLLEDGEYEALESSTGNDNSIAAASASTSTSGSTSDTADTVMTENSDDGTDQSLLSPAVKSKKTIEPPETPTTPKTAPRKRKAKSSSRKSSTPARSSTRRRRSSSSTTTSSSKKKKDDLQFTSDLQRQLYDLYETVVNYESGGHRASTLFVDLPDKKLYSDYYIIIKNPICLNTIRQRILRNKYDSISEMQTDVALMCANAQTYNLEGSEVYNDSLDLMTAFLTKALEFQQQQEQQLVFPQEDTISISETALSEMESEFVKQDEDELNIN
jgi:hypothetical protein